ncbi:hypothetical protein GCM10008955_40080 [Deinococcus malanensis]|uniref:Uncharacterized protein n=1 Tax=Deinococcus malanensis TaxID=1706855 RepID=A0ABQ2F598_9DEIO|nr:hypothetical protein GCM10008955_40080 [Deinococcus malanensis]
MLVIVPGDWDTVPEGVQELKQYLADEFGANLRVRKAMTPMKRPTPLFTGDWESGQRRAASRAVRSLLPQAFYTLDWLEETQ